MIASFRFNLVDLVVSAIVLALVSILTVASWKLAGVAGVFPRIVTTSAFLLSGFDFISRIWVIHRPDPDEGSEPPVAASEIAGLLWPVLFVGMIYVFGFFVAVPAFMALFFLYRRSMRPLMAAGVLIGFSGSMYLVFAVMLGVRLYPGLLDISF